MGNLYNISSQFFLLKSRGIVKGLFTLQIIITISLIVLLFIPCVSAAEGIEIDLLGAQNIDDREAGGYAPTKSLVGFGMILLIGGLIFSVIYIFVSTILNNKEVTITKPLPKGMIPRERRSFLPTKRICRRCKGKLVYSREKAKLYCWKCKEYRSVKVYYPGKRVIVNG